MELKGNYLEKNKLDGFDTEESLLDLTKKW